MDAGERWIAIARLLRPQGRRGEVLSELLTDLDVFGAGREIRLASSPNLARDGQVRTLEQAWRPQGRNASRIVLKISGADDISAAEALGGLHVLIPEAELPALAEDTFMVRDLLGCSLWSTETRLGTVTEIQFPVGPDGRTRLQDAPDLLVVEPDGTTPEETEPVLVPFVKAWLKDIDLTGKRITMDLPPGFFDDLAETIPEQDEEES